jgi:hypothetical protein
VGDAIERAASAILLGDGGGDADLMDLTCDIGSDLLGLFAIARRRAEDGLGKLVER